MNETELTKQDLELQLTILHKDKRTQDFKVASLEMTLASLKATLSEAHARARHAEEMVALMQSNWDMQQVADVIKKHINQRAEERAIHQQALIQATIVSLNTALHSKEPIMNETVNTVLKGLTQALGTMHEINVKQKSKQNLTRSGIDGTSNGH